MVEVHLWLLHLLFHRFEERCISDNNFSLVTKQNFSNTKVIKFECCCHWRVPFNWKNPFGYFITLALEYPMIFYNCNLAFAIVSLITRTLSNLISLAKDIQNSCISIDSTTTNQLNKLKQFIECIRLHSKAKQLSKHRSIGGIARLS